MPSHPISLRKTRYAVGKTVETVNQHADIINKIQKTVIEVAKALDYERNARVSVGLRVVVLEKFAKLGLFGRIAWLLTGRPALFARP